MPDQAFEKNIDVIVSERLANFKAELKAELVINKADQIEDKQLLWNFISDFWIEASELIRQEFKKMDKPPYYCDRIHNFLQKINSFYKWDILNGIRNVDYLTDIELPKIKQHHLNYDYQELHNKDEIISYVQEFSVDNCKDFLIRKHSYKKLMELIREEIDHIWENDSEKQHIGASLPDTDSGELMNVEEVHLEGTKMPYNNSKNDNSFSFQFLNQNEIKRLDFILQELEKEFDYRGGWFANGTLADFRSILLSKDYRRLAQLRLKSRTNHFSYVIDKLSYLFGNLSFSSIEHSELFITNEKSVPLKSSNMRVAISKMQDHNKQWIDQIFIRAYEEFKTIYKP